MYMYLVYVHCTDHGPHCYTSTGYHLMLNSQLNGLYVHRYMNPYSVTNSDFIATQDKVTPLYVACEKNNIEVVKVLLAAGAQVDLARDVSAQ